MGVKGSCETNPQGYFLLLLIVEEQLILIPDKYFFLIFQINVAKQLVSIDKSVEEVLKNNLNNFIVTLCLP